MAGSSNFYTFGRIMETLQVDSVTSEGDSTANPIENAFDFNPDTHWYPSSTADQVIALDLNNDLQEMITLLSDRDFSDASSNWKNVDILVFAITGGDLNLGVNTSAQYCELEAAGLGRTFESGKTYRIEYDYSESGAGFFFQTSEASQVIGTCVDGTDKTMDFSCTGDATSLFLIANSAAADGEFDNVSIREVTNEDNYEVDGFALFIRNYQTYFGASAGLKLEHSDDGTNWTEFADKLIETEMNNAVGDPIRIYIHSSSQKRRYWRFTFHDMAETIQIGGLYLLRTRPVSVGNAWPERDKDMFLNRLTIKRGTTPTSIQGARRAVRYIPRQWNYIGQSDLDEIVGALSDSFGSVRPLIFNEGSNYRLVRLLQNEIDPNESEYLIYSPRVIMQELPYIEAGKTF